MKHILVTTDFSPCSAAAFQAAIELQQVFAARLTIFSVINEGENESFQALQEMESVRKTYFAQVPLQTKIIRTQGSFASDIVGYAASHSVDLILIASHGRTGLERLVFGSVAEQVLREATCPVLVVPNHARKKSTNHEGLHIIVTTDLSEGSEVALPLGKSFLHAYGNTKANLTLLHVAENMVAATFNHPLGGSEESIRCELEIAAEKHMERLRSKYFSGTLAMTCVIRGTKSSYQEILDYADGHDSDLLIIASHGHPALENILLGSVAEKLIRLAHRQVLVVPQGANPT